MSLPDKTITTDKNQQIVFEPDEQDFRIGKILGKLDAPVSEKTLRKYLKFLEGHLELPAAVEGLDDYHGMKFKLIGISYHTEDDNFGLKCKSGVHERSFSLG